MTKHTPGPWDRAYAWGHDYGIAIRAQDVPFTHVCTVQPLLPEHSAEREANARLITAAPDMRDTLSELVTDFDRTNDARSDDNKLGDSPAIAKARAILAATA